MRNLESARMCAVEECDQIGRPQVCLYDGKYHRHGFIHYRNGHPFHPELKFKEGPWRGICPAHYAQMKEGANQATAATG